MSHYMKSLHVRFRWESRASKSSEGAETDLQRNQSGVRPTRPGDFAPTSKPGERAAGGCFPDILYSRFRLGIGTAGHDPETGKTIYKNVLRSASRQRPKPN